MKLPGLRQTGQDALLYARLVRWQNLLMMLLILLLLRYAVFLPIYKLAGIGLQTSHWVFVLIGIATLLIASSGYIINDMYDMKIDLLNRPSEMIIGRKISAARAVMLHILFNLAGLGCGLWAAILTGQVKLALLFVLPVALLWLYSRKLKKEFLTGNLAIAFLAALLILIPWIFEFYALMSRPIEWATFVKFMPVMNTLALAYAIFAFLVTLIREIVKDMEDIGGDSAEGCKTIPIRIGWTASKTILLVFSALLLILNSLAQIWLYRHEYTEPFVFHFVVAALMVWLLQKIAEAQTPEAAGNASEAAKALMLAGILGMLTFRLALL